MSGQLSEEQLSSGGITTEVKDDNYDPRGNRIGFPDHNYSGSGRTRADVLQMPAPEMDRWSRPSHLGIPTTLGACAFATGVRWGGRITSRSHGGLRDRDSGS